MRPPQPAHWARATGHESPGRAQLACSIARVAGCLHTDVSSPWLTHDWSDVRWEFDLRQAVGVGGLTAAAGIAIRSASCQQPRVVALVGAAAAIGLCAVARRHCRSVPCSSCCSCCSCSSCHSSALEPAPEQQIPPTKLVRCASLAARRGASATRITCGNVRCALPMLVILVSESCVFELRIIKIFFTGLRPAPRWGSAPDPVST